MSPAVDVKGGGRFRCLLPAALFAILVVLRRVHRAFQRNNSFDAANATAREALVKSVGFDDVVAATRLRKKSIPRAPPAEELNDNNLEPSGMSIYISDPPGVAHSMDYRIFQSIWDRDTTYDDLLRASSNNAPSSADEDLRSKLKGNNVTVIFHTSPKTASSTIRKACMDTQYDSCNLPRKGRKMKWPEGYRKSKRLTQLFEQCPETNHFCLRGGIPVTRNFTRFYDTRTFLHMFPFRNYDEWTVSALHQISYRDGEEGCREADALLDECLPHKFELDFGKYPKSELARFMEFYVQSKMRSSNEKKKVTDRHHTFLIYDYRTLHNTLTWLNDAHGVPLLPGTDAKVNSVRPDKSCQDEERMIEKFHDCFSDELAGLH